MTKLIILNLGRGSLQSGFQVVTASIYAENEYDNQQCISQLTGSLPAAPQLVTLYRRWQSLYESLYRKRIIDIRQEVNPLEKQEDDELEIDESDVTHVSELDLSNLAAEIQQSLNLWLDTDEFRHIERQLRRELDPDEKIRIIIQTEDSTVSQVPWFGWQFLQDYPYAEIAFGALNFQSRTSPQSTHRPFRILAILGDSTGIDVERDRALLQDLLQAEVVFLVEPQRKVFNDYLWEKQGWDILFFAGHSTSLPDEMTGRLYINPEESLTVDQLNNALNYAIAHGLQLAIFNSCDGIGLAQQLMELNLPQTIVMREPVSDRVAQEFLKYFLSAFAKEQSFLLAAREARERLQGLEGEFPGASWLPVIFQNPTAVPLTWLTVEEEETEKELSSPSHSCRLVEMTNQFLKRASDTTQLAKLLRFLLAILLSSSLLVIFIYWLGSSLPIMKLFCEDFDSPDERIQIAKKQFYQVTETAGCVKVGDTVRVLAEVTAKGSSRDNITFGILGTGQGEVIAVKTMPTLGSGTINISAEIPETASGEKLFFEGQDAYTKEGAAKRFDPSPSESDDSIQVGQVFYSWSIW